MGQAWASEPMVKTGSGQSVQLAGWRSWQTWGCAASRSQSEAESAWGVVLGAEPEPKG